MNTRRSPLILISFIVSSSILGDALLYGLLPANPDFFQVRVWQVGILLGVNRIVRLFTNELAGRLLQRSESNRPLLFAVIIGSLVTLSYSFPFGFAWLVTGRLIWGACWSVLRVKGYTTLLEFSRDHNRGTYFAVYQAIVRFGQGGGVLVGGLLSDLLGISFTYILFSLLSLSTGLALLSFLPQPDRKTVHIVSDNELNENFAELRQKFEHTVVSRMRPLRLWICGLSIALVEQMIANLTGRIVADHIHPELSMSLGITTVTGILLGIRSFSSILIGPFIGILSDKVGRKSLLITLMFIQSASLLGIFLIHHWISTVVFLTLYLCSALSSRLLIYIVAGDQSAPESRSIDMGRFSTFIDLGTAIGPVLAFSVYAKFGLQPIIPIALVFIVVSLFTYPRSL